MEETIDLLLREVNSNIKDAQNFELASTEYGNAITDTCKLLDKATVMIKLKTEADEKRQNREEDLEREDRIRQEDLAEKERIRKEELEYKERVRLEEFNERKENRKEDILREERHRNEDVVAKSASDTKGIVLEIAKVAVPVITTVALICHDDKMAKRLLKFEKDGILTSTPSRQFFKNIFKRK